VSHGDVLALEYLKARLSWILSIDVALHAIANSFGISVLVGRTVPKVGTSFFIFIYFTVM
jgi:hypothetical protein